jgi:amino acid transporter
MLVRAIGRWDLTAAVINAVVGSAIFGMPAAVAALTGAASPLAVLLAGAAIFPVVLCFAEVGSRFDAAGGPYLYARAAFGPAMGFQVGWLLLWIRLLSAGAVLNVLVAYVAALVPPVGTPVGRAATMTLAVALVTAVNVRGVREAAWTVNLFTVAKLLPLVALAVLGALRLDRAVLATQAVADVRWTDAVLLLVFAYGGFEAAVVAGARRAARARTRRSRSSRR